MPCQSKAVLTLVYILSCRPVALFPLVIFDRNKVVTSLPDSPPVTPFLA